MWKWKQLLLPLSLTKGETERARERKIKQIFKLKCSMTHNYQKATQSEIHS